MLETVGTPGLWAGFLALVLALLALDLGAVGRRDRAMGVREALAWSAGWVALALAFGGFVWWRLGPARAAEYLTGYLLEKSLSLDNLFVFLLVFRAMAVPPELQRRVLHWGILGALVLRAAMILAGAALLQRFHWLLLAFGALLLVTGVRLLRARDAEEAPHPERSAAFRLVRRLIPSTSRLEGHAFFVRDGGRRLATPLFLALCLVELSDVVFALDSIPAIFGVTLDPFVIFTSNVFAILGLRSLYFALAALLHRFRHLKAGLALVLAFIGAKMLAAPWLKVGAGASLAVVVLLLGGAMAASAWGPRRAADAPSGPPAAAPDSAP